MQLVGLWRYPVKSMQGEAVRTATCAPTGLVGDRRYAVRVASGRILSAKREGRLLQAAASNADAVVIRLPTGEHLAGTGPATDAALSSWLEQPVRLVGAGPDGAPTFESQADEADDASPTVTWQGAPGSFVDSQPLHLLTTAALRAMAAQRPDLDWSIARFRPNLLIEVPGDQRGEDAWVGRRCSVGDVELEILKRCARCVMVTRAQPGGIDRQLGVLSHLSGTAETTLGVLARVVRPGTLEPGAPVRLR